MNAMQYEELCRQFVSETLGVARHKIESRRMPAPARQGEKVRVRQVDLCWETETELGRYLTIADAKYRGQFKVDQDAVVSLQKVKEDVGAQKAMIITTTEFTEGAVETAKHFGIALHILRPVGEFDGLHRLDRKRMREQITERAGRAARLYQHTIVCKGLESPAFVEQPLSAPRDAGRRPPHCAPLGSPGQTHHPQVARRAPSSRRNPFTSPQRPVRAGRLVSSPRKT